MNILVVGSGAREHAIVKAIVRSTYSTSIYCYGSSRNPGILECADGYAVGTLADTNSIVMFAKQSKIDFAIIGPEAPLAAGLVDQLLVYGIESIGPKKDLARIESSKIFARELLAKYNIPGNPKFKSFDCIEGVDDYLADIDFEYVIKADGLMGGKGVKVFGEHLLSREDSLAYCEELVKANSKFIVEQKLIGQEFSLFSITDGYQIAHMPVVQDHKRAHDGDNGPNTGGMGSYSDSNHTLPFLSHEDVLFAQMTNKAVIEALRKECGAPYKGVLYGGYMATAKGIYVLEYNARLGDPEAMNILGLLESDFVDICTSIIDTSLDPDRVSFSRQASVCKYVVPDGYPDNPVTNKKVEIDYDLAGDSIYYGALDLREDGLYETGSRAAAFVAFADSIDEAEQIVESKIPSITGPFFHRKDIGTSVLINDKITMMKALRSDAPLPVDTVKKVDADTESPEAESKPIKIAILGSGNGTSMVPIIEAIRFADLNASIVAVMSNTTDAGIYKKARLYGLPWVDYSWVSTQEDFEKYVSQTCRFLGVDCIVLVGYMKILSERFVHTWENRILNVHPSLLPKYAGLMDLDVHTAVLAAGESETGCTVHIVTPDVDAGAIITTRKVPVELSDTSDSLKQKVQAVEGDALVDAIIRLHEAGYDVDLLPGSGIHIQSVLITSRAPSLETVLDVLLEHDVRVTVDSSIELDDRFLSRVRQCVVADLSASDIETFDIVVCEFDATNFEYQSRCSANIVGMALRSDSLVVPLVFTGDVSLFESSCGNLFITEELSFSLQRKAIKHLGEYNDGYFSAIV